MQSMSVIADLVGSATLAFALSAFHTLFLPRSVDPSLLAARGRALSKPNVPNKIRLYWVGAWQKRNLSMVIIEQLAASGTTTKRPYYLISTRIPTSLIWAKVFRYVGSIAAIAAGDHSNLALPEVRFAQPTMTKNSIN